MISGPFRKRSPTRSGETRRGVAAWVRRGLLLALALWLGGFIEFTLSLPPPAPVSNSQASDSPVSDPQIASSDGVVVLTGGGRRIAAALQLLENGAGKRLLISGVNANTSRGSLRRAAGARPEIFDCCVDIDRRALNTAGNARQAAVWARAHGYRSLTVVTADYHMPRSLLEFGRAMPGVELTAYPVAPSGVGSGRWPPWAGARLTAIEFTKYLISLIRARATGARAAGAKPSEVKP